ncbi:MAG: redox-sensing transcriptional repressor Rex [Oscillospiraceae bacterium]
MANFKASLPVIRRLPRYYRYINDLKNSGVTRVSSSQLALIMGSTPSQVRQDFNCFGGFGQQGVGYSVELLHTELENLIFSSSNLKAVLVGAGNLGVSICNFVLNENMGVDLTGIFDNDPVIIGKKLRGVEIQPVDSLVSFCVSTKPDIIIVCTPKEGAKELAPQLAKAGVKGIWNFSHYDFSVFDKSLVVENVHLRDSLMALSYRVSHSEQEG